MTKMTDNDLEIARQLYENHKWTTPQIAKFFRSDYCCGLAAVPRNRGKDASQRY